jgi:hypothetical protein
MTIPIPTRTALEEELNKKNTRYENLLSIIANWIDDRVDASDSGCRVCPLYGKCDFETKGREICIPSISDYFRNQSEVSK